MKLRLFLAVVLSLLLSACGHKPAQVKVPPPPPIAAPQVQAPVPSVAPQPGANAGNETQKKEPQEEKDALSIPAGATPLSVETGVASWYGPPYHNRRGSNGEVYDMHAMTAAHRTLPLGSVVRVTNLKTGHSAVVRITDRGPFVPGRIVDLSLAAARKADVSQPGIAKVRLEVLQTPKPLDGGRWAVQIGAFNDEASAREVAGRLTRRYHTAKVLTFGSPVGDWWVRVRVQNDDRKRAQEVARDTQTPQGAIFLVRLD